MMQARARVLAALRHEEPDRVPLDCGATIDTGIHIVAYHHLLKLLGKDHLIRVERAQRFMDIATGVVEIDEEVCSEMGVDVRGDVPGRSVYFSDVVKRRGDEDVLIDAYGSPWFRPSGGFYFDQREEHRVLRDLFDPSQISSCEWPEPPSATALDSVRDRLQPFRERYAIALGDPVGGIFASGFRMRGYREFYLDLASRPALACSLMDQLVDTKIAYWERIFDLIGDLADIVVLEDDLGQQDRPLVSPRMYRELIKPRHARLVSFVKDRMRDDGFVFLHSDGSVYELIPDLIEIGFDILNPIQVNAAHMDSARLKREFGHDIVFWGGGVDTQGVLSFGTPDQVRDEVKRRVDDLAPGGGFVFSTIHNIQPEVPPENIVAMLQALSDFGSY